jgi:hypothetical protein
MEIYIWSAIEKFRLLMVEVVVLLSHPAKFVLSPIYYLHAVPLSVV